MSSAIFYCTRHCGSTVGSDEMIPVGCKEVVQQPVTAASEEARLQRLTHAQMVRLRAYITGT